MNRTQPSHCGVITYLNLCASSKLALLVPGLTLNAFVLASLLYCILGKRRSQIRNNVAVFVLGSTICNLVNIILWPLTIHWKTRGRWIFGSRVCELMVSVKHVTHSASYHYVFFISFSIYLTVVGGCGRLVNSKLFLAQQLLFPFLPVLAKELCQWALAGHVQHLDPVNHTCFAYINDPAVRILMLVKLVVFLPLNLYIYAHILVTIFRSARQMHRSQAVNMKLAKMFGIISLTTLLAHIPGGVFAVMEEPTVCQETVKEFLLDLPLISGPIVLLCMNKELQSQCLILLKCQPTDHQSSSQTPTASDEQRKFLNTDVTTETHL
ncbi:uncharacterized protein LOC121694922 [Alosa sapidissima]|uniref:uncharacterized protein LOC121694922 n=1 Tax=Alosa sapidissima TaxID=34773 RepID=UPI001C09526F|nr:uncharacterized protein LOC121694922 [Alosa sapidissima]